MAHHCALPRLPGIPLMVFDFCHPIFHSLAPFRDFPPEQKTTSLGREIISFSVSLIKINFPPLLAKDPSSTSSSCWSPKSPIYFCNKLIFHTYKHCRWNIHREILAECVTQVTTQYQSRSPIHQTASTFFLSVDTIITAAAARRHFHPSLLPIKHNGGAGSGGGWGRQEPFVRLLSVCYIY